MGSPTQPAAPPPKSGVNDLLDILGDVANVTSSTGMYLYNTLDKWLIVGYQFS